MRKSWLLKFVSLIAVLSFLTSCAVIRNIAHPKETLLRYKLVEGETLKYKTVLIGRGETQLIRSLEQPAQKREIEFTQTLLFSQTTTNQSDGFQGQELRYNDLEITVSIDGEQKPNITRNLNTAKPILLNQPIQFLKNVQGEIKEVEGFAKVAAEFMAKKPIGQEQDVVVSTGILRSLGQFIQRVVSQNIRPFPEGPVAVGDSWQDELTHEMPFIGKIKSTYKSKLVGFTKVNGVLCAKIHYKHTMENQPSTGTKQFGGMMYTQKIKGEGDHYFSISGSTTAYLVKTTSSFTSDLEVNREMIAPDGTKQPVKNIVHMKLKSTMELL